MTRDQEDIHPDGVRAGTGQAHVVNVHHLRSAKKHLLIEIALGEKFVGNGERAKKHRFV